MKRDGNKYEYFGNKIFLEDLANGYAPHISLSRCDLGSSGTDYSDLEVAVRYITTDGKQKVSVYKYDISQSKFVIADAGNATFTYGMGNRNPQGNFPVALSRDAKSFVLPLGNHSLSNEGRYTDIYSYWTEDANVTADAPGAVVSATNFTIDSQPNGTIAEAGTASHTFSVTASNDNGVPINYQWYRMLISEAIFSTINGAVLPDYTLSASDTSDSTLDGAQYYCKVQAGDVTLDSDTVYVFFYSTSITTQPQGTVVDDFTNPNRDFYVQVATNPLGVAIYQWQRSDDNVNFLDITGSNGRSTSYTAPSAIEANRYHRCIIKLRYPSNAGPNIVAFTNYKTITSESARHATL
jgi:hypothetical protein